MDRVLKRQICVIDGRGGGMGSRLVAGLIPQLGHAYDVVGLATNEVAAEAMKQAGATRVVVGAKAIAGAVPAADVILGTLNVVLPGAMLGEITSEIVIAILSSGAKKVLLPVNRSQVEIVGAGDQKLGQLITLSLERVCSLVAAAAPV
jgi:hypothetical protein